MYVADSYKCGEIKESDKKLDKQVIREAISRGITGLEPQF